LPTRNVATADLNGDSIPDVIASEYSNDYYGNPSRVFGIDGATGDTIWSYLCQDGIRSMAVGDINGDGVTDVVAGASYNSSGTPDGGVHAINGVDGSLLWVHSIGATNQTVAIGNLNGGDYLDVVVGSFDDFVYALDGQDGSVIWSRDFGSLWINKVSLGDVDGDGLDDVGFAHEYLAGWDNHLGVLKGTNGVSLWEDTVAYVVIDVLLADIDNDGDVEAIFAGIYADDHGEFFVRDGSDGGFEWGYNIGSINHVNGEFGLFAYDVDEDTDIDLLVGNTGGYLRAFDGNNNTPMWVSDSLVSNPDNLAFADVTDDGQLNIIAATYDRVQVLFAADGKHDYYYSVAGTITSVAVGDFDDDGVTDIAAGGGAEFTGFPPDPGKTVWALRTIVSPLLWEYAFGQYGNSIVSIDLNGDTFDDVVTVASLSDQATAINGANGSLMWTWVGTENLYTITAGDFNDDGQNDVAVAGNDDMITALNGADGSVLWQFPVGNQIYRKCLKAADLNGDNNVDVIAGVDDSKVYAIDGEKGDTLWVTAIGASAGDIQLAQMNASGPVDIVVAVETGATGEKVMVLDGSDGSLLWEFAAPEGVQHVQVLDANDDGIPDIAAAVCPYSPEQVIMIDGATHTTMWSQPMDIPSNVHSMAHGDLNNDGREDIVIPGTSAVPEVRALNGGDGSTLWTFPTGGEVNCLLVFDVDNNGTLDVVVGSDDQFLYILDGPTGAVLFSYATADDVMHTAVGEFEGPNKPGIACLTFGSDGVAYAFKSMWEGEPPCCVGPSGDADGSGSTNVADLTFIVDYLFNSGPEAECPVAADVDGSGDTNVADVTYLVDYLFRSGPPPVDCP
jgi:outer membrane protein assembly factor BamB